MKKIKLYRYLGSNGSITTPILLDCPNIIYLYQLVADSGHILTNGEIQTYSTVILKDDLDEWSEIERPKEDN